MSTNWGQLGSTGQYEAPARLSKHLVKANANGLGTTRQNSPKRLPASAFGRRASRSAVGHEGSHTASARTGLFGAYPSHARTGRIGYRGNRASARDSSHRTNVAPLEDLVVRAWAQVAHRPSSCVNGIAGRPLRYRTGTCPPPDQAGLVGEAREKALMDEVCRLEARLRLC